MPISAVTRAPSLAIGVIGESSQRWVMRGDVASELVGVGDVAHCGRVVGRSGSIYSA